MCSKWQKETPEALIFKASGVIFFYSHSLKFRILAAQSLYITPKSAGISRWTLFVLSPVFRF